MTPFNELLDRHRWDIWAASHNNETSAEIADRLGCPTYLVHRARKRIGCSGKRGRRLGFRVSQYSTRNNEIIALRREHLPYKEIGARFDITGERVRQIIARYEHETDEAGLTGPQYRRPPHACPVCQVMVQTTKNSRTCSRLCANELKIAKTFVRREAFIREIVRRRLDGQSWREIRDWAGHKSPMGIHGLTQRHVWRLCLDEEEMARVFPSKGTPEE